jgi:hypothetical protein
MTKRVTAGELSQKALADTTKYDALEVGHAMTDDVTHQLRECVRLYRDKIDEDEFCVIRIIASDPLIKNAKRFKYYAWPYLPAPRPNQAVFLYNKPLDQFTKRLWILPSAMVMAELAGTSIVVDKRYQTMQAWSVAFFKGTFWEYIRHEHDIDMLSQEEYMLVHREELIKAGCKLFEAHTSEPFDFSKIAIEKIVDTKTVLADED